MFIDADIQFRGDYVIRLLLHNKEIVTGAYPLKVINYNNIENKALSANKLASMTTEYVINARIQNPGMAKQKQLQVVGGLIEVLDAGTGFMLIKREVFQKFIDAYPKLRYTRDVTSINSDGSTNQLEVIHYAFFDTSIDEFSNRYLSEDYTFCRRWQK
ncbi:MAG: hypothetical protein HC898_03475 [Phycisphaerales bacterium]|nr:hypothetical protein [Phycisphaerales bacterium]